jgi:hypothetical protein
MTMKTTEGNGSGTLRRLILVLLVAALMAAMMTVSAMPASAAGNNGDKGASVIGCSNPFQPDLKGKRVFTPSGNFSSSCHSAPPG